MSNWLVTFAAKCSGGGLFKIPHWYDNLECRDKVPQLNSLMDFWVVVANAVRMALGLAGVLAVGFIIYGGIMLAMSQGEPERITSAKNTIINAVVGLVIAILSSGLVGYIATKLSNV